MRKFLNVLFNNRGEVNVGGEETPAETPAAEETPSGPTEQEALEQAILESAGIETPTDDGTKPTDDGTKKPSDETKPPKKETPDEDPELEFQIGEGDKAEKKKFKTSEIVKAIQQSTDYTQKTQEIAQQREQLQDFINWIEYVKSNETLGNIVSILTEKAVKDAGTGDGKVVYNDEYLKAVLSIAQGKTPQPSGNLEPGADELEKLIGDLDPEHPAAKAIKAQAASLKALQEQISKVQQTTESREKQFQSEDFKKQVEATKQIFEDTITQITDEKSDKALKFEAPEVKELWRSLVVGHLKNMDKSQIKSGEDFMKATEHVAREVHSRVMKAVEAVLAIKLKDLKKPDPVPQATVEGKETPAEIDADNLTQTIENMLVAESEAREKTET